EATVHLPAASNSVWIAHATPYPLTRLQRLLDESAHSPYVRLEVIGHSLEGRELQLVTVTDSAVSALNKKCIWLITRQHAWETGTSYVLEGALRFLLSDQEQARDLRKRVIFRLIPTMDPDGLVHGHVRFNSLGYDLNRHWSEVDPRQETVRFMPEISS